MVDFHTHILPGIDDGSRQTEESLELLRLERASGVDTVVLTPHFYASQNSPEGFLERRARAWDRLCQQLGALCVRVAAVDEEVLPVRKDLVQIDAGNILFFCDAFHSGHDLFR